MDDESSWAGDNATIKTTTKLIELIHIAIDAWSYSRIETEKLCNVLQDKLSSSTTLNHPNPDMLRLCELNYRGVIRTYIWSHDNQNLQLGKRGQSTKRMLRITLQS